jgi:hypothetical protein
MEASSEENDGIPRLDMEALAPSLGRLMAIEFPAVVAIAIAFLVALFIAAVGWRRIAPLRERVRRANEENDCRQRRIARD